MKPQKQFSARRPLRLQTHSPAATLRAAHALAFSHPYWSSMPNSAEADRRFLQLFNPRILDRMQPTLSRYHE